MRMRVKEFIDRLSKRNPLTLPPRLVPAIMRIREAKADIEDEAELNTPGGQDLPTDEEQMAGALISAYMQTISSTLFKVASGEVKKDKALKKISRFLDQIESLNADVAAEESFHRRRPKPGTYAEKVQDALSSVDNFKTFVRDGYVPPAKTQTVQESGKKTKQDRISEAINSPDAFKAYVSQEY